MKIKTCIKLDTSTKREASILSLDRLKAFSWVQECKYGCSTIKSNNIGSYGELGLYQILKLNNLNPEKLFTDFKGKDEGDIKVGDLYIEVKTRSVRDHLIYGPSTQLKQVDRFRSKRVNLIYVFMSYDRYTDKVQIEEWNKLDDFTHVFKDGKYMNVKPNKKRKIKNLIKLCINSYINQSRKEIKIYRPPAPCQKNTRHMLIKCVQ